MNLRAGIAAAAVLLLSPGAWADSAGDAVRTIRSFDFQPVRLAVRDLAATYGARYPGGALYLKRSGT
jgi:hypothetical protein